MRFRVGGVLTKTCLAQLRSLLNRFVEGGRECRVGSRSWQICACLSEVIVNCDRSLPEEQLGPCCGGAQAERPGIVWIRGLRFPERTQCFRVIEAVPLGGEV